ncbi:Sugar kinase, ribokinase family [Archaeoglobus sulfaticallidus PM70-1]|uniref:Sugar kinase, ribokinase family n=1 Tax=Archaeoglobus sulfaticallidus PM70-1 TaxID=387631 RepID=N0BFX0_9EURY|nr:carbohydrate kinase family protein [Archaeoglobus sulfaticallidus]AGK61923.1 Sugar kinase, ribokinase family [Archaeoglobus sulfaticallidus PM70-1]
MIAGFGPALVDYTHLIDKYPPAGGHAIVRKTERFAGGAAGNVIFGLSKLGLRCRFYTTLGEDDDSRFYLSEMRSAGVEVVYTISHRYAGKCDIYVDPSGERTFFVHPNSAGIINLDVSSEDFKEIDYVYLDPFPAEMSFEFHLSVAKKARKENCCVMINPGFPYISLGFKRLKELLKYCDIVFMSRDELEAIDASTGDFLEYVEILVVTMGKEGSSAYTRDKRFFERAFEVKTVDTTGAGDAFAAGFIYAYTKGYDLEKCLKTGNYVASVNVQKVGARNFPDRTELDKFLKITD